MRRSGSVFSTGLAALILAVGCSQSPVNSPVVAFRRLFGAWPAAGAEVDSLAIRGALSRADAIFISQYRHQRWNPTEAPSSNANCGPTSLAMALAAFGRWPSPADTREPARLIRRVRFLMTGAVEDGYWTYPIEVLAGARAAGLNARFVYGLPAIREAMARPDRLVILNLNPTPAYVDALVKAYDGGHFALLTAIDGDKATLCDPLAPGPLVVTLAQLDRALSRPLGMHSDGRPIPPFGGGVLVWP